MAQQDVARTVPVFRQLFRRYGVPKAIRVDNGSPFGSKGPAGLTRLSAWWLKLGVEVEFIRAGHPEDNAGHEHFHRILKAETANPPAKTWRGQQRRTHRWLKQYNEQRPHEAIGMKVPMDLYRPGKQKAQNEKRELGYPEGWESRYVKINGMIHWRGQIRSIGEAFARERVGLKKKKAGVWQVYFGSRLLGELWDVEGTAMRPAVYRQRSK